MYMKTSGSKVPCLLDTGPGPTRPHLQSSSVYLDVWSRAIWLIWKPFVLHAGEELRCFMLREENMLQLFYIRPVSEDVDSRNRHGQTACVKTPIEPHWRKECFLQSSSGRPSVFLEVCSRNWTFRSQAVRWRRWGGTKRRSSKRGADRPAASLFYMSTPQFYFSFHSYK